MKVMAKNVIDIGDIVKFKERGYIDVDDCYEVIDIDGAPIYAGGISYILKAPNGKETSASPHEIYKV